MDIMRQVEESGSASGDTSAEIVIANCGLIGFDEVAAFKAYAAAQQMEKQIAAYD